MSKEPKIDHEYHASKDKMTITIKGYLLSKKIRTAIMDEVIRELEGGSDRHVADEEKKSKSKLHNRYTAADVRLLRRHSRARTPVSKIVKVMKRSEGSLRQKALKLGFGLGHQR